MIDDIAFVEEGAVDFNDVVGGVVAPWNKVDCVAFVHGESLGQAGGCRDSFEPSCACGDSTGVGCSHGYGLGVSRDGVVPILVPGCELSG